MMRRTTSHKFMAKTGDKFYGKQSGGRSFSKFKKSVKKLKEIKETTEDDVVSQNTFTKGQNEVDLSKKNLHSLLNNTNTNLNELKNEVEKLSSMCHRVEPVTQTPEFNTRFDPLRDYKADLLNSLKNENHKLSLNELKLNAELTRMREQNSYLSAENQAVRDKTRFLNEQGMAYEKEILGLKQFIKEKEEKIVELEQKDRKTRVQQEYEQDRLKDKDREIEKLRAMAKSETEQKEKYHSLFKTELQKNSTLQLTNDKLKSEGKKLIDTVESLELDIRRLKLNNQEALEFIKGRNL